MSLKPAIYVPTGTWWTRTKDALFTAYVNCWIRYEEQQIEDFYVQLDNAEIK